MGGSSENSEPIGIITIGFKIEEYHRIQGILGAEGGYDVNHYATGQEGIEQCKLLEPDAIIIDRNTPDMYDLVLLKELKSVIPDAYIIMASHSNEPAWMQEAMILGASDFLSKPIDKKSLLITLGYVLGT